MCPNPTTAYPIFLPLLLLPSLFLPFVRLLAMARASAAKIGMAHHRRHAGRQATSRL